LAWLLGGLIGWQREATGRAAGLRTHVLVCVAPA
jgi:putative Mg2+ transporter-C (MgtC) family protein